MSNRAGSRNGQDWRGYSNVALSEADIKAIWDMAASAVDYWSVLEAIVTSGYRAMLRYDEMSGGWCVGLTGVSSMQNDGLTLTSWARDLRLALCATIYKHATLTDGVWPGPQAKKGERDVR